MYHPYYHYPYSPYTHCRSYPQTFYHPYRLPNQYPAVNTTMFKQSVNVFRDLMQQGELLLDKLEETEFAYQVMDAAQQGKQAEVDRLIHSINGFNVPVEVRYTPSGIIFDLQSKDAADGNANCCTLNITLKWGL